MTPTQTAAIVSIQFRSLAAVLAIAALAPSPTSDTPVAAPRTITVRSIASTVRP